MKLTQKLLEGANRDEEWKYKIYFKRQVRSKSDVGSVLKALSVIRSEEIERDKETGLVTVKGYSEEDLEYIERHNQVAFAEEIK